MLRLRELHGTYPLFSLLLPPGHASTATCGLPYRLTWRSPDGEELAVTTVLERVSGDEVLLRAARPQDLDAAAAEAGLSGPVLAALLLGRSEASLPLTSARLAPLAQ